MYDELLWVFSQLPHEYLVLDTETTGLRDENGMPDIVTLGITVVINREVFESVEFKIKPQKQISPQAQAIHGFSNQQAAGFATFSLQWGKIAGYLKDRLVVIHNASFDWPILLEQVNRDNLDPPNIQGVFCSQKAAIPWAQAMKLPCSHRGPSLDTLTKALGVEDLRAKADGVHGAKIDSYQTAKVIEAIRGRVNFL